MSEKRIQRINELIKEEISKLILKEIELSRDVLVTVTRVETTQDLLDANVFVSIFPESNAGNMMKFIGSKASLLQYEINKILKMRPLPRLHFLPEKETKKAARIEEILEQLKNKGN